MVPEFAVFGRAQKALSSLLAQQNSSRANGWASSWTCPSASGMRALTRVCPGTHRLYVAVLYVTQESTRALSKAVRLVCEHDCNCFTVYANTSYSYHRPCGTASLVCITVTEPCCAQLCSSVFLLQTEKGPLFTPGGAAFAPIRARIHFRGLDLGKSPAHLDAARWSTCSEASIIHALLLTDIWGKHRRPVAHSTLQ